MERTLTGYPDTDFIILQGLSDEDLVNVCEVNKYVYELCQNNMFWMNRTIKRFGNILAPELNIRESIEFIRNNYLDGSTWKQYYQWLIKMIKNPADALLVGMTNRRDDIALVLSNEQNQQGKINFYERSDLLYIKPEIKSFIKNHLEPLKGDLIGIMLLPEGHSLWDYMRIIKQYGIISPYILVNTIIFIIEYYKYPEKYIEVIDDPYIMNAMAIPDNLLNDGEKLLIFNDTIKNTLIHDMDFLDTIFDHLLN